MAERYQGQLEMLDGRSPLIVISGAVAPTDLAARAARCALAVHSLLGGAPMTVVTGRAEIAERLPSGELIDRAAALLPCHPDPFRAAVIRIERPHARARAQLARRADAVAVLRASRPPPRAAAAAAARR
jgi:eukaryotic-like serine/threonine-protein kinase